MGVTDFLKIFMGLRYFLTNVLGQNENKTKEMGKGDKQEVKKKLKEEKRTQK